MRKLCLVLTGLFLCITNVDAAVRTQNAPTRQTLNTTNQRDIKKVIPGVSRATVRVSSDSKQQLSTTKNIVSRNASTQKNLKRRPTTETKNKNVSRVATKNKSILSRAAATKQVFSESYTSCREAYFSCMDQFCATQNEDYRRCVCSSRLSEIQSKENKLSQTADSLKDFQDLNIAAISKTAGEVNAMVNGTAGETAIKKDKSSSANTLNNISSVLNSTKQQKAQNQINNAADIKSAWNMTDLIGGTDIANLTGESFYNAVHAQCSEIVSASCNSIDLNMAMSAYGMYIENDCTLLANNLETQKISANASIRTTRTQMHDARLENYNAHNSLSLNDCIAKVRQDVTADIACGDNYVHCLDITGKYLNQTTGVPIYTPDFYQLENQLSLSGDALKNNKNTPFISVLNGKRVFAKNTLDTCRDNADDVWNEFVRQALVEIYQGQRQRVQEVKTECLRVVNECYLKQNKQLETFSNNSSEISLGQMLELSEEMCKTQLTTCSNLYGGGSEGLALLVNTMTGITDETIAQTCPDLLNTYVKTMCSVQSTSDSVHKYPYNCRTYAPGEMRYAQIELCNSTSVNPLLRSDVLSSKSNELKNNYSCSTTNKVYTSCTTNYYLYNPSSCDDKGICFAGNEKATECHLCPAGYVCPGGQTKPYSTNSKLFESCGIDYIESMYQKLVLYALQNCIRPSRNSYILPESILADVDTVMKQLHVEMASALSDECERKNGTWVEIPWKDTNSDSVHDITGDSLLIDFYTSTGANKLWGYCK